MSLFDLKKIDDLQNSSLELTRNSNRELCKMSQRDRARARVTTAVSSQLELFDAIEAPYQRKPGERNSRADCEMRARISIPKPVDTEWAEPPRTLAEAKARLDEIASRDWRINQMRSALNKFAEVIGQAPGNIPADVAVLRSLIENAAPALVGLSRERWTKVVSGAAGALRAAGMQIMPGRHTGGMSESWTALYTQLPSRKQQYGLTRMLSWFSEAGIEPSAMQLGHIVGYGKALVSTSLSANPQQTFYMGCWHWNNARELVADWPPIEAPQRGEDPRRLSLDWEEFPSSFRDDAEAFLKSRSAKNPFRRRGAATRTKASTEESRRKIIRFWASAQMRSGFAVDRLTSLAVLVDPDNVDRTLTFLLARDNREVSDTRAGQVDLLKTIARHWVKNAEFADELANFASDLRERRKGMTQKNYERLRQFDLPANVSALYSLSDRIFREVDAAEKGSASTRDSRVKARGLARRAMFGLMVELLTVAPVRIDNLVGIELDRHLVETRRGSEIIVHLDVPGTETKTGAPIRLPLPRRTLAMLRHFVRVYRPRLVEGASKYLFPGRREGRRATTGVGQDLSAFLWTELGLRMNPHLFRSLAAKVYLSANPHDIETVRLLLGHQSQKTTLRAYAELSPDRAFKSLEEVIAQRFAEEDRTWTPPRAPKTRGGVRRGR